MDQDRVLGEDIILEMYTSSGLVQVGEIDSVDEDYQTEQKTSRPLGQRFDHQQTVHKGWQLQLKGGKVDESVDMLSQNLQDALQAGQSAPRYRLTKTTTFFDQTVQTKTWDNGLCYDFKESAQKSDDEVTWDFTFWAPLRSLD